MSKILQARDGFKLLRSMRRLKLTRLSMKSLFSSVFEKKKFLRTLVIFKVRNKALCHTITLVMSVDLQLNGKTSSYTNLIKILSYYITPFNFNHGNLNNTRIMCFVAHIHFAIHKNLNFIMF